MKLELEQNQIVPLVFIVTTKQKNKKYEEEIRKYLQLTNLAVWEDYRLMENE